LAKIINIGTAVPAFRHNQMDILHFMNIAFGNDEVEARKLRFLYHASGIQQRHSVLEDYSLPQEQWKLYGNNNELSPFPTIEQRQALYDANAALLSKEAIEKCIAPHINKKEITHLITVSCTGMSAPGLDLQLMEMLELPANTFRTSINFMGCYAAIHALKLANLIVKDDATAKVVIVCAEFCTLHFQKEKTNDNITANLLFADGVAAALIVGDTFASKGLQLKSFYSEVDAKGKNDMSWQLGSNGFKMTLSGYVPQLLEADFKSLIERATKFAGCTKEQIKHWCIHPGGKAILHAIQKSLALQEADLQTSADVLANYGNMSSVTILFVLQKMMQQLATGELLLGAAFGPGLTNETFIAEKVK
jgi:predicted naringenin-chalcone synthase